MEISCAFFFNAKFNAIGDEKMNIPTNLKYSKTDEWFDPASGKIGLTDFAQSQLSDIVFVEIVVNKGESIEAGKQVASVESVKAAADSYSPVGGKVADVNEELSNNPEILNKDPYGAGWMAKVEAGEATGLLDAAAYAKYCEGRSH
jgi:glycine cleavage system H protein